MAPPPSKGWRAASGLRIKSGSIPKAGLAPTGAGFMEKDQEGTGWLRKTVEKAVSN